MSVATEPITGTFVADPNHSSFQFEVTHMEAGTFRGGFTDVAATAVLDEQGIRLEGSAQVGSITILDPPPFRDQVLNGADFFDAPNHPELTFRSTEVRLADDGTLTGKGELTIKGITKPITATGTYRPPVEDPYGNIHAGVQLTTTVDRREWDMDYQTVLPGGGNALGYEIGLSVNIEFIKES